VAPPLVARSPHPFTTTDVVLGGLPGFVGSAARHGLFQCQLADRQHRLSVDVVQLLADLHPVRVRNHHFANGDHGRVGHRHRRRDRPAFAFFIAKIASRRSRQAFLALVFLPLWASYLARVYAWINILSNHGVLPSIESHLGLPITNLAYTNVAMWIVFSYLWLPFMIVPIYGAFERVPDSLSKPPPT